MIFPPALLVSITLFSDYYSDELNPAKTSAADDLPPEDIEEDSDESLLEEGEGEFE